MSGQLTDPLKPAASDAAPTQTILRPASALSLLTRRAYQGDWNRFADWCAAADHPALPTTTEAVAVYLDENPAAPATQARRVAAINRHHLVHGYPAPGHDPAIVDELNALRGRSSQPRASGRPARAAVEDVLRLIPSHGWPTGLFGRRDRCLLVISQIAGLSHTEVRDLNLGDVEVDNHGLAVHSRDRTVHIAGRDDPTICPACIYRRWHIVRDALERQTSIRSLRRQFHQAREITTTSPHICHAPGTPSLSTAPLFIAADRHGWPVTHTGLSTRAISTIVAASARGQALPHRTIPVNDPTDADDPPHDQPAPVIAPERSAADLRADYQAALTKRQQDRGRLDTVDELLRRLTADLDDLQTRTTELLDLAARSAARR